jgi:hypothetical protein
MHTLKLVPDGLIDSWHGRLLAALYELYDVLDADIERWRGASGLSCLHGCRDCCSRYEPSVLPVEGMAGAGSLERRTAGPRPCPRSFPEP